MKKLILSFIVLHCSAVSAASLSQSVGLFVYPSQDQSTEQQGKDDYECYNWAQQQTGVDPMNPPEAETVQAESGPDGSRLRGAARGAAAGAIIGEIANDDASDGAAVGAAVGAMRGGRQSRRMRHAEAEAQTQQNQRAVGAAVDGFKKAMSACLTARGYAVQ